jgi:hypothetical protein
MTRAACTKPPFFYFAFKTKSPSQGILMPEGSDPVVKGF